MERNAADLDDPPLTTSLSLSASTRGSYLFYSPPISLTRVRIGFLHVGESFLLFFFPVRFPAVLRSPAAPPPPLVMSAAAFPFIHHFDVFPRPERIPSSQPFRESSL